VNTHKHPIRCEKTLYTNKTQIEANTMLTTLLELELAGTVETLRGEICMLSNELELTGY